MAQLDVSRPILVGHSWGTLVALEMALDNPLDTAGLVLLSGYYFPTARADVALAPWPAVRSLATSCATPCRRSWAGRWPLSSTKALRAVRRDSKVHGAFPIRDDAPPISESARARPTSL